MQKACTGNLAGNEGAIIDLEADDIAMHSRHEGYGHPKKFRKVRGYAEPGWLQA